MPKELVAASAEPIILSILKKDESYGYEIIKSVSSLSGGRMNWTDGMLYPVLHRLERKGFLSSFWKEKSGRRRKYYKITRHGQKKLKTQLTQWETANSTVASCRRLANA